MHVHVGGRCLHVCMCVAVAQIHLNLCMWRSGFALTLWLVAGLLTGTGGSQIKLDCMVLPRSQVLSPAPTWPLRIICNSSCKGFSTLFWPLCVPDMYVVYLHICRQNTHTYKIKISTFLNIKYQPWPWHCWLRGKGWCCWADTDYTFRCWFGGTFGVLKTLSIPNCSGGDRYL